MRQSKKLQYMTTLLMVALVGLISVQIYWIYNVYTLKEKELDQDINKKLVDVGKKTEDLVYCFSFYGKTYIKPGQGIFLLKQKWKDEKFLPVNEENTDSLQFFNIFPTRNIKDSILYKTRNLMFENPAMMEVILKFEYRFYDTTALKENNNYSPSPLNELTKENLKNALQPDQKISTRLNFEDFDTLLHQSLHEAGITTPVCYAFRRTDEKDFEYISNPEYSEKLYNSKYKAGIFTDRKFVQPYEMAIYFEKDSSLVLKSMMGSLVVSIVIILILISAFAFYLSTILRQKKLGEMKNDFISNMTHEFKTPITNISLALENLVEKKDVEGYNIDRLIQIIENENSHMKENVERVLQITLLDKNSIQLKPETLDMHDIIHRVAKSFEMQLAAQNATFTFAEGAQKHHIMGDETHMINVFYNLMDNAIKYSAAAPQIKISTWNVNDFLFISISDKGIGMTADTQKRIFDKFFRAGTGNVHNVKGFGLGLSYVKSILDAHQATIEVKSEQGKGTTFTLKFRLIT